MLMATGGLFLARFQAGIWLMAQEYGGKTNVYGGTCMLLQNLLIFLASMVFKFGRGEDGGW